MNKTHEAEVTHSPEEQSRRSACDRCRGQKLRCERKPATENGGNACKRCIKARVRCISSPQRRLGRPRQQSLPHQSRASTPLVLDFDAFLDSREAGNPGDDVLDMCSSRTTRVSTTNATVPRSVPNANNNAQQADTMSPFDSEYMVLDSPMFHGDHNSYSPSDTDPVHNSGYLKDDCLEKLSILNSSLFRQLSSITSRKLGAFSLSSTTPPMEFGEPFSSHSPCNSPGSPIGNMLQSSQEFLDILRCFLPSEPISSTHSPSHSSLGSSFSEFDADHLFSDAIKFEYNSPTCSMDRRSSSQGSYRTSNAPPAARQPVYPIGTLRSDIPSTLAILTCYVCLVRIYRTVFAQIHQSLLTPSTLIEVPAILPGLQLGGFQLDGNQHLQIKVLVEVSMHMLDQIEAALGLRDEGGVGENGSCGSNGGLLEDSVSATLLNIVINQEAVESMEGDRAGVKSLRTTVKSIEVLLKGGLVV